MNLLKRSLAPVPDVAWKKLDDDSRQALREHFVARRVVDFDGPRGAAFPAVNLGTIDAIDAGAGVVAGLRRVQPLLELRVPFTLVRAALDDAARGAPDFDTSAAVAAARRLAELEDGAVLRGNASAGIRGIAEASPHPALALGEDPYAYADVVTRALLALDDAAVAGPYALLLGSSPYRRLASSAEHYPPLSHLAKLLGGGPVLHARVLDGGLLLSLRGGDFRLTVGQDSALGYHCHDAERLELFFIESFTFQVLSPEAAVRLIA